MVEEDEIVNETGSKGTSRAGGVADVLVRIVERRSQALQEAGYGLGLCKDASSGGGVVEDCVVEDCAVEDGGRLQDGTPGHRFLNSLRKQQGNAIIAEVKLGSPKLGDLRQQVNPEAQALVYRTGGAAALSVVVEPDHFFGSYQLLERCCLASGLPAIAKDFVVSEQQFRWALDAGACAVLLIASLYEQSQLWDYVAAAHGLGLVALIETHTESDLAKLSSQPEGVSAGVPDSPQDFPLVGINNRDLRTFSVDIENSVGLRPSVPSGALVVAESGIAVRADIERLAGVGFDAFLIGESLLLAQDPGMKLAELRGTVDGGVD